LKFSKQRTNFYQIIYDIYKYVIALNIWVKRFISDYIILFEHNYF